MLVGAVIMYFLFTLAVGFYVSGRVKGAGDFINAGRNLPPAMNAAALFALWFGSETVFGASSEFAIHGIRGVIEDPLGGVLCLLLVGIFFSRKLYSLNIYTIGDLFRQRYGAGVESLSSVLMVLSFVGYAAGQMVALGLITHMLTGFTLQISTVLGAAIVMIYTFTGGMWAVSVTDFLQSIMIVTGLLIISWYVTGAAGGTGVILASLPPEHRRILPDNTGMDWLNWLAAWMVLGLGSIASQDVFQRINSARSAKAAYYSTITGALLYLVFAIVPLYLVLAARLIDPSLMTGDLQMLLPRMILSHMPQWLQVLFFGSLLSAIMSTCSGALLAPASLLSENLIKPYSGRDLSDARFLLLTRLSVIFVGVSSLILAMGSQNIFSLVGEASVIGLVSIFVPFVASLFFGHSNRYGAFLSMIFGTLVYALCRVMPWTELNPLLPGLLAAIIGLWSGNLFAKAEENKTVA